MLSSEHNHLEQQSAVLTRCSRCKCALPFLPMERLLCAGEDSALWIEEADGAAVARITEQSQLERLLAGLNRRGMRERALITALKRRQKLLASTLSGADPGLMPDVLQQQADRCMQDKRAVLSHAQFIAHHQIICFACPRSTLTACEDGMCTSFLALSCVETSSLVMHCCLRQELTRQPGRLLRDVLCLVQRPARKDHVC